MTESEVLKMKWYQELQAEIQAACDLLSSQHDAQVPILESERTSLEQNVKGWSQTLANPDLKPAVRAHIESQFNIALERIAEIDLALNLKIAELQQRQSLVAPDAIADRLNNLADVLASNNPSWGGVELAHHIDRIDCYDDGKVLVRTCKLGALEGAVDIFSVLEAVAGQTLVGSPGQQPGRTAPRRLTRRRIETGEAPKAELRARAIWASDPFRFAGLNERWFVEHVYQVPKRLSWAAQHALEVAALRKKNNTEEMLAKHFGKSLPTIHSALKIAKKMDPELAKLPRRMPRARWHEENALEVALKKASGMSTLELAEHFGKSDTTIRAALNYAKTLRDNDASPEPARG
jgi:hypothetical protein